MERPHRSLWLSCEGSRGLSLIPASCYVAESVQNPAKQNVNNVIGTLKLLEALRAAEVQRLVFSSTCSTYGDPVSLPMSEDHPQQPVNPYGMSKLGE